VFPDDLVPVARHPLITAADGWIGEQIRARQLYRYLYFTAKLEHLVVNRTVLAIAHGTTGFDLPEWMELDAYKIYVDEGYHAFVAADLAKQVASRSHAGRSWARTPYFLSRLQRILQDAGPELAPLFEMLFVVISETLISGTLSQAASLDVSPAIRDALGDHARDERRHQVYFSWFLRAIWPQLSVAAQRQGAVAVPELIDTFLRPDREAAHEELQAVGFGSDDAAQIVAESYPDEVVAADRRHFSRYTIRLFEEVGALSDSQVSDAFQTAELLSC